MTGFRVPSPELQAEWAARLAASGFVDVELLDRLREASDFGNLETIREAADVRRRMHDGTPELYQLADRWINIHRWRTRGDRAHFADWANGRPQNDTYNNHTVHQRCTYNAFNMRNRALIQDMLEWHRSHIDYAEDTEL